jgi:hypothetical protein
MILGLQQKENKIKEKESLFWLNMNHNLKRVGLASSILISMAVQGGKFKGVQTRKLWFVSQEAMAPHVCRSQEVPMIIIDIIIDYTFS